MGCSGRTFGSDRSAVERPRGPSGRVWPVPTQSEMLSNVPFFALLDDQERAALADRLDVVTFPAGQSFFSRGDPGDSMYVVRSGVVEMWFKNDVGDRIILETARAGDFFGEISLLDGGPRNA